jgi:Ca-activated chloride channel family protein
MKFLWPQVLWLLLAVPAFAAAYVALLRRRKRSAVRLADLALVREALGAGQGLRRHLPPLLLLLAFAALVLAAARPQAIVTLPSEERTIILAIDVSLSMRAADVKPSRIAAAQAAAKEFVQEQPADVRVGIVSFAGTASVVQPPTRNRDDLVGAIDRFELQRHTAIGSAIILSLATLFPQEGIDLESAIFGLRPSREAGRTPGAPLTRKPESRRSETPVQPQVQTKLPPGSYPHAAIILLTDGRRTTGPDPLDAARMAADRGVRVYTVGFGTKEGAAASVEGYSIYMQYDEETLRGIAELTRGEYFHAATAEDLRKIYDALNTRFVLERQQTEVSGPVAGGAAALTILAGLLSLLWFRRAG